eukprot:m.17912 g.17912  ORF g.17912 m.17912 type:complete len:61 (-) comp7613_c0_seq2:80-262(-)
MCFAFLSVGLSLFMCLVSPRFRTLGPCVQACGAVWASSVYTFLCCTSRCACRFDKCIFLA